MGLAQVVQVVIEFRKRANAVAQAADRLRILAREDGVSKEAAAQGAIELLVQGMLQHPTQPLVQSYSMAALRNICGKEEELKLKAIKASAIPAICLAISKHSKDARNVAEHGFALATILVNAQTSKPEDKVTVKRSFLDAGAYRSCADVLKQHESIEVIEVNVCLAINAFCRDEPVHADKAYTEGLIPIVATIVQRKGTMHNKSLWNASRAALGAIITDSPERKKEAKKHFPWGTRLE